MTHEERIVNVLAEDVDTSRRADDVARRMSVMPLELLDEVIPACPGEGVRISGTPHLCGAGCVRSHSRFTKHGRLGRVDLREGAKVRDGKLLGHVGGVVC
jgi:hypothetical protein